MIGQDFRKYVPWALGICFGLVFFILLSIRADIWQTSKKTDLSQKFEPDEKESWLEIYRHDQKIGYSLRRLLKKGDRLEMKEITRLKINIMGMIQDVQIISTADLNADYSLSSFAFDMSSGRFDFKVKGKVRHNELQVVIDDRETEFPIEAPIFLLSSLADAFQFKSLTPGKTALFEVFDPSTLNKRKVRVACQGYETLDILHKPLQTKRFSMEAMGITQLIWTNAAGQVVQETGPMGIRLTQSTRQKSLEGFEDSKSLDLAESFSIPSNVLIADQNRLTHLKISVRNLHDRLFVNGGRQTLKAGILTLIKENPLDPPKEPYVDVSPFLNPSPGIQSDDPRIMQKVSEIVSAEDAPLVKAEKIMSWIYGHIQKRPVLSIPDAVKTLENGMGDCNEHAVLFAAMARAAGIPAQVEAGLLYLEGRFYYHAWNVFHAGGWITLDSLMGQMPADVAHIRLIRGDLSRQLDLIHAIDQLQLEVLEPVK